jgi:hypothetical protein
LLPIEKPSKRSANSLRQDHVRRDLAHHIHLQAVDAALQALRRHDLEHPVGFERRATERNHHQHVAEPEFVAQPPDRAALEREPVAVVFAE